MKKLLIILGVFCIVTTSNATHIIGGYIRTEYLGNSQYLINLVVYRDCYYGVPPFDNPGRIGIYTDTTLVSVIDVFTSDSATVFDQGICIPGNVCVRVANYYTTVTLPSFNGVTTIVYQRCCRSQTILNLTSPLDYGMSFYSTLNTMIFNSSVEFNSSYTGFTYVGDNFSFDASATDPDGDSLVYYLEDPAEGASQLEPLPMIPSAPPYASLIWQPPFSKTDMLSGPVPLTIDPVTGIMTAIPGTSGVFCIAYKVEEYRNGNLINTTRKEMVISVSPPAYFDIDGFTFADNGSQPLDEGNAWLIRLNLNDSILTATDTNLISGGNFQFQSAINSIYLLKSSASPNSIFYADNMPTYYGDVLFWHQAQEVELCTANASNVDIMMVQGVNPGGPGFVGGLISQGANKFGSQSILSANEGITVILFNQLGEPVAYATTDAAGYFSIGNIPLGTYSVYIDRINYLVDNNIAPQITLTSSNPSANNLAFTLYPTRLELNGFVGLTDIQYTNNELKVFPNPVKDILILHHTNENIEGLKYTIYNLMGEEVLNDKMVENNINVGKLTNQIYILKLETKSGNAFVRFVKM